MSVRRRRDGAREDDGISRTDPMRYDRARGSLDRHPTYTVAKTSPERADNTVPQTPHTDLPDRTADSLFSAQLCEHYVRPGVVDLTHLVSATSNLGVSVVAAVRSSSELSTRRQLWMVRPGAGRGQ